MIRREDVRLPEPRPWPEPITLEEYSAFAPEKLDLVDGYLIDGPEEPERRIQLLALLLRNCGLEAAMFLSHKDDCREAVDRGLGGLDYT
ncbi:MAG TPA: hypothetical protein VMM12_06650 [Longimicrobiales bacterium]|nr:hypothetical protein [Longimicrobiales bacterium]